MSLVQVTSQANLTFNQVKNFNGTWTFGQSMNAIIVPIGKVLKIESATFGILNNGLSGSAAMLVGNHIVYSGSTFYGQVNLFPLWLSEGSYTVTNSITSGNTIYSYSISGIEFNVVP